MIIFACHGDHFLCSEELAVTNKGLHDLCRCLALLARQDFLLLLGQMHAVFHETSPPQIFIAAS